MRSAGLARRVGTEEGSAAAEFVLTAAMVTVLVLAVMQFGYATFVANVCRDAVIDGAHYAALVDVGLEGGQNRARDLITRTIGAQYASDIGGEELLVDGVPTIRMTVRTVVPLFGPFGVPGSFAVSGHAPVETLP